MDATPDPDSDLFCFGKMGDEKGALLPSHPEPNRHQTDLLLDRQLEFPAKLIAAAQSARLLFHVTPGTGRSRFPLELLVYMDQRHERTDPSPGLYELESSRREFVEREFPRELRFHLRPIGSEALVSSSVKNLGEGEASVEILGEAIWTESEEDGWADRRSFSGSASSRATRGRAGRVPNEREEFQPVALSPIFAGGSASTTDCPFSSCPRFEGTNA